MRLPAVAEEVPGVGLGDAVPPLEYLPAGAVGVPGGDRIRFRRPDPRAGRVVALVGGGGGGGAVAGGEVLLRGGGIRGFGE